MLISDAIGERFTSPMVDIGRVHFHTLRGIVLCSLMLLHTLDEVGLRRIDSGIWLLASFCFFFLPTSLKLGARISQFCYIPNTSQNVYPGKLISPAQTVIVDVLTSI